MVHLRTAGEAGEAPTETWWTLVPSIASARRPYEYSYSVRTAVWRCEKKR